MVRYENFMIDLETLALSPDAVVVDISVIPFDFNERKKFDDLVEQGKRLKLSIDSQKDDRTLDADTLAWWMKQPEEARKHLEPSDNDLTVGQAVQQLHGFLLKSGINPQTAKGWCRGTDFDFPIINSMLRQVYGDSYKNYLLCKYWNQRDVRTALDSYAELAGVKKVLLPEQYIEGFVAHDSLHDCAKAIIELRYARALALGAIKQN